MPKLAAGVTLRHARSCPATKSRDARCKCKPTFRAQAFVPDPDRPGRGRRLTRTFATATEAREWLERTRTRIRDGQVKSRPDRAPTLNEAAAMMKAGMRDGTWRKRGGDAYRPGVIRKHEAALRLYVLPTLGAHRLDQIAQPDLLGMVDRLQARGLGASTIRNAVDPLRVIYRRAVARGVVTDNPTRGIELPSGEQKRDRVADPSEATRLIAALPRHDDRALWAVALYCGLRGGELRALRWRHVNLARAAVTVRDNISLDVAARAALQEVGDPKTKAGSRTVPIPPPAHDALTALKAERDPDPDALVYPGQGGQPFARTTILRRATTAWTGAGLDPIGLHEARHSAASMWIASGLPLKMVSELIGHASIQITLDRYGHLFEGDTDIAGGVFAEYLQRADTAARLAQLEAAE